MLKVSTLARWLSICTMALLTMAGPASAADPAGASEHKTFAWQLGGGAVVEGGAASRTAQGWIVHDFTVKAAATAVSAENPVPAGRFLFRGTVFSPLRDMPGQKAGRWYLQGSWSITADGADAKALTVKHNPYLVEGELRAELPFNPAERTAAPLEAKVLIPHSLAAGRWTQGGGTFTGNGRFEGQLSLEVGLRPDVSAANPKTN